MNLSQILLSYLNTKNVKNIFTISGAKIDYFLDHLSESPINPIIVKHEAMAVTMAIGTIKAGAEIGVVATTAGAAAFNIVPMLAEAYSQKLPILSIIGTTPPELNGTGQFQEASGDFRTPNIKMALSAVSKKVYQISNGSNLIEIIKEIEELTKDDNSGPISIIVPYNLFNSEFEFILPKINDQIYTKINSSINARPHLIVIGTTLSQNEKRLLQKVAEVYSIAIATTADKKGEFSNNHPSYIGVIGIMGNPSVREYIERINNITIIGSKISAMDYEPLLEDKNLFTIGTKELYNLNSTFLGSSIEDYCNKLLSLPPITKTQNIPTLSYLFETESTLKPYLDTLSAYIQDDEIIVADAGNSGVNAVHYLSINKNSTFDIALGMGGMGYSFGTAIGYAITQKKRAWIIAGDGSFFMHGFELHTAIEYSVPIVAIIINNRSHGMCELREEKIFNKQESVNHFKSDTIIGNLSAILPSVKSYRCNNPQDFVRRLQEHENYKGVLLLEVLVNSHTETPFLPLL